VQVVTEQQSSDVQARHEKGSVAALTRYLALDSASDSSNSESKETSGYGRFNPKAIKQVDGEPFNMSCEAS
jgi:hypothetical protein